MHKKLVKSHYRIAIAKRQKFCQIIRLQNSEKFTSDKLQEKDWKSKA